MSKKKKKNKNKKVLNGIDLVNNIEEKIKEQDDNLENIF